MDVEMQRELLGSGYNANVPVIGQRVLGTFRKRTISKPMKGPDKKVVKWVDEVVTHRVVVAGGFNRNLQAMVSTDVEAERIKDGWSGYWKVVGHNLKDLSCPVCTVTRA